jgi:uncharacterized flavoprotein (TIGR03862 family)
MKKSVALIGGGAANLFLAAFIDTDKYDVTIYEQNKNVGRKFLVAGDGGLNLSHSEDSAFFVDKYQPANLLKPFIEAFSNNDLRTWLKQLGIETFVGSSGRIFPEKTHKPIEVLNKIVQYIEKKGVNILGSYQWLGWENEELIFNNSESTINIKANYTVFALGGGSWHVTGSTGKWTSIFEHKGLKINPLQSSNCAFGIAWNHDFISLIEGQSLKNITVTCDNKTQKGEVVLSKFGIEGGGVYALSPQIRTQLQENTTALIHIDLKPSWTVSEILDKLTSTKKQKSWSQVIQNELNINKTVLHLLKNILTKEEFKNAETLAFKIKHLPLIINSLGPIDEAISTVGGIALEEISENLELKKIQNTFCIGEMLDWDAPTGGYLLQGCFSMGVKTATYLNTLN